MWGFPNTRELGPNLNSQMHLLVPLEGSSEQPCPEKCWPLQAIAHSFSGVSEPLFYSDQQCFQPNCFWHDLPLGTGPKQCQSSTWSGCWLQTLCYKQMFQWDYNDNATWSQTTTYEVIAPFQDRTTSYQFRANHHLSKSLPCSLTTTVEFLGLVFWGWISPD